MNMKFSVGMGLVAVCLSLLMASCNNMPENSTITSVFTSAESQNEVSAPEVDIYYTIKVVDSLTNRGIPMVELRTTNNISYYTDSAGLVAFFEPGLMDQDVFFNISSHGYQFMNNTFGFVGQTLRVRPGESITLKMTRKNIAQRIYRLTGQGIYRDSTLLGVPVPIENPNLNARVQGQDSTQAVVYKNQIFWIWGDTGGPFHPLGNFRVSAAVSDLPENGGLSPDKGVNYSYFTRHDGFVKEMVPKLPGDPNLVWLSAVMTAPDNDGNERLMAKYTLLHGLGKNVESGIMVYNDETNLFDERHMMLDGDTDTVWNLPGGQATRYKDGEKEYYFFSDPFPNKRVEAKYESIINPDMYEFFTCLAEGTEFDGNQTQIDRNENGEIVWEWKKNTAPITQEQESRLIQLKLIEASEAMYLIKDKDSNRNINSHAGSIRWNEYLDAWVFVFTQIGGQSSFLGEIWFSYSTEPTGPWNWAKKIVSHEKYGLYNVVHHRFFDQDGGKTIYFEGTYSSMFDGSQKTPRYDYNQIMYQLDLSDERLRKPED